jgi:hypothetical protein
MQDALTGDMPKLRIPIDEGRKLKELTFSEETKLLTRIHSVVERKVAQKNRTPPYFAETPASATAKG